MSQPYFRGAITALITPFRDGRVDEETFAALVERQIAAGIHGLVPVGTTGEASTLSHDEHKRVVELCVQTAAGRVPVIAGAGSNSTAEVIELMSHAKAVGADGALLASPYYNRPSQEGIFQHYKAVNDAVQLPFLVYNVPSRTSSDMGHEVLVRLSKLPNVVGIKDATGDMSRCSFQRADCGDEWTPISGDDSSCLGYMAHGGCGVISVTSNVAPEGMAAMMNAALAGDFKTAGYWNDRLAKLHTALFKDSSPSPTKFAMTRLGLCTEEIRLPLVPCRDDVKDDILAAMRGAGVLN
jgi:4-hydroxy-tetrahydrodipicolinate synthase